MTDLLIGVAVLGGIVLFVYALYREARKQRSAGEDAFRSFARERGWRDVTGDPDFRPVLEPFEGIGAHRSSSLGDIAPSPVFEGRVESGRAWVFRHRRRFSEGDALQFYGCLLSGPDFGVGSLVVRFGEHPTVGTDISLFYTGRASELPAGDRALPVFEAEPGSGARSLSPGTALSLLRVMDRVPWPVDLQVRGRSLALYTTARNLELTTSKEVGALLDATCGAAAALTGPGDTGAT